MITDLKNPVMALYRTDLQTSMGSVLCVSLAETPAAVQGKKGGQIKSAWDLEGL